MKNIFTFSVALLLLVGAMLAFVVAESATLDTSVRTSNTGASVTADAQVRTGSAGSDKGRVQERKEKIEERTDRAEQRLETRQELLDERGKKIAEFRERIGQKNGELRVEGKYKIHVQELSPERKALIAGKINAKTGLNLSAEDIDNKTALRAYLSNGRHATVKIMPDRASAVALQRLRAKCVERNCSVELKEVGKGNTTRLAYQVTTDKDSRVFFIFKKRMIVKAEVDAETGDIILAKKPWWAFLAKEKHAAAADIEADVGASADAGTESRDVATGTSMTATTP